MKKQILVLLLMGTVSSLLGVDWNQLGERLRGMTDAEIDILAGKLRNALREREMVQREGRPDRPATSAKPTSCATCGNKGRLCTCSSTPSSSPEACDHTGACGCGVQPAGPRVGKSGGSGARWEKAQKDREATFAARDARMRGDADMAEQLQLDERAAYRNKLRALADTFGVDTSGIENMNFEALQELEETLNILDAAEAANFVERPKVGADVMDDATVNLIQDMLAAEEASRQEQERLDEEAARRLDIEERLNDLRARLVSLEAVLLLPDLSREKQLTTEAQISVVQEQIGDLESELMFMDQK